MDQWIAFLQERWFIIIGVLVVLLIVINIVKTVVKWVIVLAMLAGLFYYGASYTDQLKEVGGQVLNQMKDEAMKAVANEAKEAKYEATPDGGFKVSTPNIRIEGKVGAAEATLYFKDKKVGSFALEGILKAVVDQAKQQAKL